MNRCSFILIDYPYLVLTVILASCLLVISTACSQDSVAQGGTSVTEATAKAMSDTYDDYDANQSFEGGMNGYNDDRRYDGETAAKAKALVDRAESRQTDNLGDYTKNIIDRTGDNIEETTEDVSQTLQANTEDAVQDIKQRTNTLQSNLGNASNQAQQAFDEATAKAQNAVEDAKQATKSTAKDIQDNLEDLN